MESFTKTDASNYQSLNDLFMSIIKDPTLLGDDTTNTNYIIESWKHKTGMSFVQHILFNECNDDIFSSIRIISQSHPNFMSNILRDEIEIVDSEKLKSISKITLNRWMKSVIELICTESVVLADSISFYICRLFSTNFKEILLIHGTLFEIMNYKATLSTGLIRYIILLMTISKDSDICAITSPLLNSLLSENLIRNNDVLAQLVLLENIHFLIMTSEGLKILECINLILWLIEKTDETNTKYDQILESQSIIVVSDIYLQHNRLFKQNIIDPSILFKILFQMLEKRDQSSHLIASNVISKMLSVNPALIPLFLSDKLFSEAFFRLSLSPIISTQECFYNSLTQIFTDSTEVGDASFQHKKLFELLGEFSSMSQVSSMRYVIRVCRVPMHEIREAALHLLSCVCRFDWAIKLLNSSDTFPYFQEFLSDWFTESSMTARSYKFNLLENLARNSKFTNLSVDVVERVNHLHSLGERFISPCVMDPTTIN